MLLSPSTMKTILLPFNDDDVAKTAFETAYLVATRFGSYIEGLFILRPPQIIAGEGVTLPGDYVARVTEDARKLASAGRECFSQVMSEHNIELHDVTFSTEGVSAGWNELEGLEGEIVGDYGRLFDLIVIGRSAQHASANWNVMCESALFDSGRPVLVAPNQAPSRLGDKIVIAWNGSTETARTIALGMPFLVGASTVLVLTVEGGSVLGPDGEQIANHLCRNGIQATAKTAEQNGRSIGEAILEEANAFGADLLLKGAYTQSRLRQMIFGGATRHILSAAAIPVLMAH